MMKPLSIVPYFHYDAPENWERIKGVLIQTINDLQNTTRVDSEKFQSSANNEGMEELRNMFTTYMQETLQKFGKEIGAQSVKINNIWTVVYEKGDFHDVHNHGLDGLTGILYLEFDPDEHPATIYVGNNNFVTNHTELSSPAVKEGEMVFVPSYVLHYTRPNESNKPKIAIAMDIVVQR